MTLPAETSAPDGALDVCREGCHDVELATPHGPTLARLYQAVAPVAGVVMVGGVGGFDSPARGLYPRLASALLPAHVCSLRVKLRDPRDLDEAVMDVVTGVDFLVGAAVRRIALVGHSFGGAVVISAAAARPEVVAVVALATQSHGARPHELGARRLLLVHGTEDESVDEVFAIVRDFLDAELLGRA